MNIIPIIAKADTISKSELHKFKIKIMGELVSNGVQIYQFPTDDEAVAEINAVMNVSAGQGPRDSRVRGLEDSSLRRDSASQNVILHRVGRRVCLPDLNSVGTRLEDLDFGFALRVP